LRSDSVLFSLVMLSYVENIDIDISNRIGHLNIDCLFSVYRDRRVQFLFSMVDFIFLDSKVNNKKLVTTWFKLINRLSTSI